MTARVSVHLGTLLYVSDVVWDVGTVEKSRAGRRLTKKEAVRLAGRFVENHYPLSVNAFAMTVHDHRNRPQLMVSWLEKMDAHTITGANVIVTVDRRIGRVVSYGASLVPPDVPKPRVTAEQAIATARRHVGKPRGKLTFDANGPQLVLSSPLAPKEGPVWAVSYHLEWTVKGHLIESGDVVTIDAVTGKVISLAELPLGTEKNPTQSPPAPRRRP